MIVRLEEWLARVEVRFLRVEVRSARVEGRSLSARIIVGPERPWF
jgi:hypothetical protein